MAAPKGHPGYPGSEKGGRPKIYTDQFIEKEADALEKWIEDPSSIYLKSFCLKRKYHPRCLSEFAEKNQRFKEVYEQAKTWQECKLSEGGLTNAFNSGIVKFLMSNICGFSEKPEQQNVTNNTTYNVNYADSEQILPEKLPAKNSKSTR